MGDQAHWESRYANTAVDQLTWYQATPAQSLAWIERSVDKDEPLIDVGAGASTLVDHLLMRGYSDITLLDLADEPLAQTRVRLGERGEAVKWIRADITHFVPQETYALWHDRAVLHFLTDEADRRAYREALLRGLRPGGWLVLGTFAVGGPEKCSGLPVRQYDQSALEAFLGPSFTCVSALTEEHPTPAGKTQLFHWGLFRRGG